MGHGSEEAAAGAGPADLTDPSQAVRSLGPRGPRLQPWEAALLSALNHGVGPVSALLMVLSGAVLALSMTTVAVFATLDHLRAATTGADPGAALVLLAWVGAALTWLLLSIEYRWAAWHLRRRPRRDGPARHDGGAGRDRAPRGTVVPSQEPDTVEKALARVAARRAAAGETGRPGPAGGADGAPET